MKAPAWPCAVLCAALLGSCSSEQKPTADASLRGVGDICGGDDECAAGLHCPPERGVCTPRSAEDARGTADSSADGSAPDGAPPGDGAATSCSDFPDRNALAIGAARYKTKLDDLRAVTRIMYVGDGTELIAGKPAFLRVTVWQGLQGSPTQAPAAIELQNVLPAADTGVLVRFGHDCDAKGSACATEFVGYSGKLTVSAIDWAAPVGSTFAGALAQVAFKQVTFDESELPTPVPGGCAFTLGGASFSGPVTAAGGGEH